MCTFSRYWNVVPLTYDTHGIITENASSPYVQEEARINKIPVRQVENLPATVNYPINKLLLTGDPVAHAPCGGADAAGVRGQAVHLPPASPSLSRRWPLGVGKDTSLEMLLQRQRPDRCQLDGRGDGWNDLPMIRCAGMGVAMAMPRPP